MAAAQPLAHPSAPRQHPQVNHLRACQLCGHRMDDSDQGNAGGELLCACPLVAGAAGRVPCHQARQRNGGCGPNASHLLWSAIDLHPAKRPSQIERAHA